MNRHSILLKIGIFFIIAFLAFTVLFKFMYEYEFLSVQEKLKAHYHKVARYVMQHHIGMNTDDEFLKNLNLKHIKIIDNKKNIIKNKKFDSISCGMMYFDLYEQDGYRYMMTPEKTGSILLKDMNTKPIDIYYMWWLYGAFVIVFFTLFISIAISIYPLKYLQLQIKRFGDGETGLDLSSNKKDEIADVANEFDNTVKKIQAMMNSRAIFLRNITHELKTPITKGQISLEFLEESRTKEILENVFVRLNLLVREFLQIENVTACDCQVSAKSYHIIDILDNAVDLLFLEQDSVEHNISNRSIDADFDLMSIVFKNLIDNGLKYSDDSNVYITLEDDKLAFCSRGQKMEHLLEYYIQPFTKQDINLEDSFGLGLYIVYYILNKHGFTLSYNYDGGINSFIINLNSH